MFHFRPYKTIADDRRRKRTAKTIDDVVFTLRLQVFGVRLRQVVRFRRRLHKNHNFSLFEKAFGLERNVQDKRCETSLVSNSLQLSHACIHRKIFCESVYIFQFLRAIAECFARLSHGLVVCPFVCLSHSAALSKRCKLTKSSLWAAMGL